MAANSALELSIRIAGKLDPSLAKTFSAANKQVSGFSTGLNTIAKAAIGSVTAAAAAMAVGIDKCTESAATFKNEMADVVKYVNGLADENGLVSDEVFSEEIGGNGKTYAENYAEVAEILKSLSTQIPMTKEGLTQLAAAAGQSGKEIGDLFSYDENGKIQGFLRDAAMLGAAWDIDADKAGDYAAKWEKSFALSHDQVMTLADQINYLGANTATTAAEIAAVVNDSAGLGQIAGMTPATTAALADAMLAMGVNSGTAATSVRRLVTNMSLGTSATDAQEGAWLKLGFTAEGVAKSMQENSEATMLSVFRAINALDKDEQVGMLKTLFGQWSIEGAAKITGNIGELVKAFEMVQDFDSYNGSMQREFIIKSSTPEAVDLMASNAWDNLKVDIGDSFLPIQQELALMKIDLFEGIRANLPELSQLADSVMPLIRAGMEGVGTAIENALPHVQNFIDYILNNGDEVANILATIGVALAGMLAAPKLEGLVKGAAGLFGASAANGVSAGATTGTLAGLLNPFNLVQRGVSAAAAIPSAWQAIQFGAGMANSNMTLAPNAGEITAGGSGSWLTRAQNSVLGGIIGFQNRGKLTATTGKTGTWWKNALGVAGQITTAKQNGGLMGMVQSTKLGGGIMTRLGNLKSIPANTIAAMTAAATPAGTATATIGNVLAAGAGSVFGKNGLGVGGIAKGGLSVMGKLGGGFMSLMGTFGPIITGLGTVIALAGIFGDHLDDIRGLVESVFGEKGAAVFDGLVGTMQSAGEKMAGVFSPQGLQSIQTSIRTTFGDGAASAFGTAIPLIESFAGVFGQIVDLGQNHIKPILEEIFRFVAEEGLPALMPLLSSVVGLIGTTLVNAIKVVMDVVGMILPVAEPVILGIIDLAKGIVSVVVNVVNGIIGALNKIQITVPDWSPVFAGKTFGFNLQEVALPEYATGGFTHGISIAGEAGTEAVISFDPSVRSQNITTWLQAGQMLGLRQFGTGGFTDSRHPTMESAGRLILFGSATSLLANAGRALLSNDPAVAMQDLVGTGLRRTAYELVNFASDGLTMQKLAGGGREPIYLKDFLPRSNEETELKDWPDEGGKPTRTGFPGGAGGDRPVQYVFAPQITIYGDADREEISETMDAEYEKFKRNVERYEREQRSTKYA